MNPADLHSSPSWRGYAPVWVVLALGLAVSSFAAAWLRQEARRADEKRFAGLTEQTRQTFEHVTEKYQQGLQLLADAIGAREDFSEEDWYLQMVRLQPGTDYPGLVEIGAARTALATNLPPELEDVTSDDFRSRDPERRRQYGRAVAFVKGAPLRIEPLWDFIPRSATKPHGQGVAGESLERETEIVNTVLRNHAIRMTGTRVVLRYKKGEEVRGTTLIVPVPGETLARPWPTNVLNSSQANKLKYYQPALSFASKRYTNAVVYGSFDWQQFIHSSLSPQSPELHLDLYASNPVAEDQWLGGSGGAPLSSALVGHTAFRTNYPLNVYRSKWVLVMQSTPLFAAHSADYRASVALVGGILMTSLMATLLAVQIRARVCQQNIAGELRQALTALEAARTERERVGRDLHDGAIQSLYGLQLGLSRTGEQARAAVPEIAERLTEYRRGLSAIIGELRQFILRDEAETSPGANLCRVLTASIDRLRLTTAAELSAQLDSAAAARLNSEQAVQLANIAREALSNSLRHGSPSHVKIALSVENGTARLEISDDGCGFDPAKLPQAGMGLANMLGRAREAGGELKVDTSPGNGTRVVVLVAARKTALPNAADGRESV